MSKDILDGQKHSKNLETRPKTTPEVSQVGPDGREKIQNFQCFEDFFQNFGFFLDRRAHLRQFRGGFGTVFELFTMFLII